jgi:hypothetical protein
VCVFWFFVRDNCVMGVCVLVWVVLFVFVNWVMGMCLLMFFIGDNCVMGVCVLVLVFMFVFLN